MYNQPKKTLKYKNCMMMEKKKSDSGKQNINTKSSHAVVSKKFYFLGVLNSGVKI